MLSDLTLFGYSLEVNLLAFFLGSARLLAFVQIAPFFGSSVIMPVRFGILLSLYLVLHPAILPTIPALMPLTTAGLITIATLALKEVFIGFVLGYLAGLLFWTIESAGFFIDNQRGAGQATETDPLSGQQSSPIGSFFFQSLVYVFYASGAFVAMLVLVYSTYEVWPVGQMLPYEFFTKDGAALFFGERVSRLAADMMLLSAPVVLACLFTDISLGLINRFASQLNVYVLAMGIKSGIAAFLLLIYLAVLVSSGAERFSIFRVDLLTFRGFF